MFVWRDSLQLKFFDTLAILTILAVLTLPVLKIKISVAGVSHYLIGFIWCGLNTAFAPFYLLFGDIKWTIIPQTGWTKHLSAVLRGLAIVAPILLIFGALFVAADAVFQGIIERTFNIQPELFVPHFVCIGFLSWIIAGYLRGSLIGNFADEAAKKIVNPDDHKSPPLSITEIRDEDAPKTDNQPPKKVRDWQNLDNSLLPKGFTLGAIEISIVLGLIDLLFLSFVVVQISYLFGGFELVQNTPDFKLAEYARRGFGELVAVAALVLPILLGSHWLLRKDSPVNEKIYRVLAGMNIGLLFVIMVSAAQRLYILTGNLGYGLTTVRFYPAIVMIWLAIVFVWFALTVLRGERQKFAWGALCSAFFILGILHFVNPDAYIVRTNIRLMQEGRSFDARYNSDLSDDAVPVLLENLPAMKIEQQCVVKNRLSNRANFAEQENDFRSFNFSRWLSREMLDSNKESLSNSNCSAETRHSERDDNGESFD